MKNRKLYLISLFLIFIGSTLESSIGSLVKKTGEVFLFENSYYPEMRELTQDTSISINDYLFTKINSKAFLKFLPNTPIFLSENTSIVIKKIKTVTKNIKEPYDIFLNLNYGEIKLFKKNNFVVTPQALIQTRGSSVVVNYNNKENFTTVFALKGKTYITKNSDTSKQVVLDENQFINVFSQEATTGSSSTKDFIVQSISKEALRGFDKKYDPLLLLKDNYKPSFLDLLFRKILLF